MNFGLIEGLLKVIAPASDEAPKNVNLELLKTLQQMLKSLLQKEDNIKFIQLKLHLQTQLQLRIFVLQKRIIKKQGYSI